MAGLREYTIRRGTAENGARSCRPGIANEGPLTYLAAQKQAFRSRPILGRANLRTSSSRYKFMAYTLYRSERRVDELQALLLRRNYTHSSHIVANRISCANRPAENQLTY